MAEYVARACTCHRGYNTEPKTKENRDKLVWKNLKPTKCEKHYISNSFEKSICRMEIFMIDTSLNLPLHELLLS